MGNEITPDDKRALDTLTPAQLDKLLKVIDAILATAPTERPPHWTEVPDTGYDPYQNGKEYMLWDLAQMLRKAMDTAPAPAPRAPGPSEEG